MTSSGGVPRCLSQLVVKTARVCAYSPHEGLWLTRVDLRRFYARNDASMARRKPKNRVLSWGMTRRSDPKDLRNDQLLQRVQSLVSRTNRDLAELLWHLAEVDARGLYRDEACSSMFTYCRDRLGFSEPVAFRRITAFGEFVLRRLDVVVRPRPRFRGSRFGEFIN